MDGILTVVRAGQPPRRIPLQGVERWPATQARLTPRPVAILRHRGHGPLHHDWLLSLGATCATVAIYGNGKYLRAVVKPDHRRRYLTVAQGPIAAGRGAIVGRTQLRACWCRSPGGWLIRLLKSR